MEITATSGERFSVKMSVGPEFIAKFDELKSALSHVVPDGNFEEVMLEAFDLALEACAKRQRAATSSPKSATTDGRESNSRHIPAAVKREVSKRDGNRCAFVGTTGKRCNSRHQLEFHHIDAFARGGEATVDNIGLRCRAHNHFEALLDFGEAHMERARAERRASSLPPVEVTPRPRLSVTSTGGSSETRRDH